MKIERELVTDWVGDTAAGGFTLTRYDVDTHGPRGVAPDNAAGWIVSDGTAAEYAATARDALLTFADFIETFVDDYPGEVDYAPWRAAIEQARADAAAMTD